MKQDLRNIYTTILDMVPPPVLDDSEYSKGKTEGFKMTRDMILLLIEQYLKIK